MAEYSRQPGDVIQAGFALNAGKLLAHYTSLTLGLRPEDKYDAPLVVCVLQSLLTNCTELLSGMRKNQKAFFKDLLSDVPHEWGLRRSFVEQDTFPIDLTLERVLGHLRNALSHPTAPGSGSYLSTGYTTLEHASRIVSAFRFTDSPWVHRGEISWRAHNRDRKKVLVTAEQFERCYDLKAFLKVRREPDGTFGIAGKDGQTYMPLFVIVLPLSALAKLAKALANHLAQPTNKHWDGRTVHPLVAEMSYEILQARPSTLQKAPD